MQGWWSSGKAVRSTYLLAATKGKGNKGSDEGVLDEKELEEKDELA